MVEKFTSADLDNCVNDARYSTAQGVGRVWAENAPLVQVPFISGFVSSGSAGSGSTANFSFPTPGDPTGGNQVLAVKAGATTGTGVNAFINALLEGERIGVVARYDSDPFCVWVDGEVFFFDLTQYVNLASLSNASLNNSQGVWLVCKDRYGRDAVFDKHPKAVRLSVTQQGGTAAKQANIFGWLVTSDTGRKMSAAKLDCQTPGFTPNVATLISIGSQGSLASLIYNNTDSAAQYVTLYQSNGTTQIGTVRLGAAGATTAPFDTVKFDFAVGAYGGVNAKIFHAASVASKITYTTVGVGGQA